jgi:diguanylate cyclase (GGDEF)-like protein
MRASSADALIGKTDFDFYPEATARQFRSEELSVLAARREMTVEQQATFADGAVTWLSTLKVPFRAANGDIVGLITHNRDVTSTRRMQSELDQTRQHLADALANMADGVVMYDSAATILLCNDQYRSLFPRTGELRVPGARLPDILREAVARGEEDLPAGVSLETWIADILAQINTGGRRLIALADGRWIEARNRLSSDGGSLELFSDVTARKQEEEMLRHRAEHDPLTGLANRAAFEARLDDAYRHASENGSEFAVILLDLDRFKQVNDTFGHKIGDHLLVNVARRLEAACRHGDLVARLGGDEFAVVSEGFALEKGIPRLAQRILDGLTSPFEVDNVTLQPSGSIGFTIYPGDPAEPDGLVTHADEALYAAKAAGRRKWLAYAGEAATASVG